MRFDFERKEENYEFCNESQEKKPPGLQDAKNLPCTPAIPADQPGQKGTAQDFPRVHEKTVPAHEKQKG
jgi:hypothetical protein